MAKSKMIFVFGSNEAGIHGAGAAKYAHDKLNMRYGFSYGHCGQAFAIPTKDINVETIPISRITLYVMGFLAYALGHKKMTFQVTRIGCGLAGLTDDQIAPLFKGAPDNCQFDEAWKPYLGDTHKYWGSF